MQRPDGWRGRLARYIAGHVSTEFVYGKADCALFTAGAVAAVTGVDLARAYRGYKTKKQGLERLKASGHASPVDLAAAKFDEIHPSRAQCGDIAVFRDGRQICTGIFYNDRIAALRPDGLGWLPRDVAIRGFAV